MAEEGVIQRHRPAFIRRHNGRRLRPQVGVDEQPDTPAGRIPRISKLMALAIRFERLLQSGEVRDQAEIAELGHVTRARVTQIMKLLHLAPDIQEAILFLPRVVRGRDPIAERHVRPIVAETGWDRQRALWHQIRNSSNFS